MRRRERRRQGGAETRQYNYREVRETSQCDRERTTATVRLVESQRDSDHSDQIRYLVSTLFITTLDVNRYIFNCLYSVYFSDYKLPVHRVIHIITCLSSVHSSTY